MWETTGGHHALIVAVVLEAPLATLPERHIGIVGPTASDGGRLSAGALLVRRSLKIAARSVDNLPMSSTCGRYGARSLLTTDPVCSSCRPRLPRARRDPAGLRS